MPETAPIDLQEYERAKFELAEVIRSAERATGREDRSEDLWRKLLARLAEDRFTVVVAGRFSRGKSSLLNALLGVDRLPTGVVPLTSVITYVRYGSSERVVLEYLGSRLRGEARLDELEAFVTERGNPANVKRLRAAEIQLPAEILRRGFFLVDTPGLGSAILENTETTERFIPEIDMLVLVTGFESPMSQDELAFLHRASRTVRAVFVVVNKHDTVGAAAREEALAYVDSTVRAALGALPFRLFSVSAKRGLEARVTGDAAALEASGIAALEAELVGLLATAKARLFLSSTCDRIRAGLDGVPDEPAEALRATLRQIELRLRGEGARVDDGRRAPEAGGVAQGAGQFPGKCEVCEAILDAEFAFLAEYQLVISTRASAREDHAARGGFCPFHSWRYERIASPRGTCAAYPPLLARTAARLRAWAAAVDHGGDAGRAWRVPECPVCALRRATLEDALATATMRAREIARSPGRDPAGVRALCLPHLELTLGRLHDVAPRRELALQEAAWMERIAEDMQRYAVKLDGLRRFLASEEEARASTDALRILAGHRDVSAFGPAAGD